MNKKQVKKPKEEKKKKEEPKVLNPDSRRQMVWKPFGR